MAGEDDGFSGEARLTPGFTVGFLAQEPQLDPTKDVAGNVADGVAETKGLVDRFNEVCAAMGDPDADFDKLLAEQADLQDKIDAAGAWDLDRTFEIAMDALRLPPGDADVPPSRAASGDGWPSAGSCCPSPTCCCSMSRPTTSTPSRWPGWSAPSRTTRAPWWPSPTTATSSTTWPVGSSSSTGARASPGRATTRPGWSRSRPGWPGRRRPTDPARTPSQRELEWIRMSPRARQSKGKARITAYNDLVAEAEASERRSDKLEITIPPGPVSVTGWSTPRVGQGVR